MKSSPLPLFSFSTDERLKALDEYQKTAGTDCSGTTSVCGGAAVRYHLTIGMNSKFAKLAATDDFPGG